MLSIIGHVPFYFAFLLTLYKKQSVYGNTGSIIIFQRAVCFSIKWLFHIDSAIYLPSGHLDRLSHYRILTFYTYPCLLEQSRQLHVPLGEGFTKHLQLIWFFCYWRQDGSDIIACHNTNICSHKQWETFKIQI